MRRSRRPEMPSIARGHPRSCVDRYQSRARSRVFPRQPGPRRPFTPRLPERRFRDARGYRGLDPRPCPSSASRCSRETPECASLDPTAAQRLLQLTYDARTHSRASDSRASMRPASFRGDVEPALVFATLFRARRSSPLEEESRELRAETVLPRPAQRRCKHAARQDPESHPPTGAPLAGDASIRPPFAAMAVGKQRWTARAE